MKLGDASLERKLRAFCLAHYNAPEVSIVRTALTGYIDKELAANAELKRRFNEILAGLDEAA